MRVKLHGMSHDVGYLDVAPVVHLLHGVQDTPLHRLKSVGQMRNCAVKYHIAGIVQEPVLVHAAELVNGHGVVFVGWLITGVLGGEIVFVVVHP